MIEKLHARGSFAGANFGQLEKSSSATPLHNRPGIGLLASRELRFKDVHIVDPFAAGRHLRFPSTLHADNWLISCFGRSLNCSVPDEPLQALARGEYLCARCDLLLTELSHNVADFVVRKFDEKAKKKWEIFKIVMSAHDFVPMLRTAEEIRANPLRLQNLERLRQRLVQQLGDPSILAARSLVKNALRGGRCVTLGNLIGQVEAEGTSRGSVEAAVIELYRSKTLYMNVGEAVYGEQTRIQLL